NWIARPPRSKRSSSSVALILVFFSKVLVIFRKNPRSLFFLPVWPASTGSYISVDVFAVYNGSGFVSVTSIAGLFCFGFVKEFVTGTFSTFAIGLSCTDGLITLGL